MCWGPVCDAIGVDTMAPTGEGVGESAGGGKGGGGCLALAIDADTVAGRGAVATAMGAKVAVPTALPEDAGGPNGEARAPGRAASASNDQGSGDGALLLITATDV